MRLSFLQYVALTVFAPLAMLACDIPVPGSGGETLPEPVWADDAQTVTGELTDSDSEREGGKKQDRVANVRIPAGATLQVLMESPTFDTYLYATVGGSDQTFSNDDFNGSTRRSFLSQTNPLDESVIAAVYASAYAASARGEYTVRYQVLPAPEAPAARAISVPGRLSGTISSTTPEVPLTINDDARRADAYSFSLQSGQSATVRMESTAFDTYLKVLRNGIYDSRNDDFGGSRAVSQVTLSQPGTYTVLAGAFAASGAGAYTLSLTLGGDSTPTPAAPTPEASGEARTIEGGLTDDDAETALTLAGDLRKADAYPINLDAGQTLVVELESPNFDTYLKLDFAGAPVDRNDDAGSTRRSAFRYRAVSGGTYTLYAGTFTSSGRGAYTLTWRVE